MARSFRIYHMYKYPTLYRTFKIFRTFNIERLPIFNFLFYTKSRYKTDFKELGRIGKGGFGQVFRVVHKIDSQEYAIKRVKLSFRNSEELKKAYQQVSLFKCC